MARAWYSAADGCLKGGWTRSGSSCCSPAPTTPTGSSAAWSTARPRVAFEHARELVNVERSLGLFFEPGLQQWALNNQWIIDAANWSYINSHFLITTTFLIWLYLARNESYYYVRNMFMVAMGFALVLYIAYPTAPPRFLPEWGFADTVTDAVGQANANNANLLYNPYAAVPSMHVAFALMVGIPAYKIVQHARAQGAVGGLPGGRHVRGARHRQPLLDGRRARRRRRRRRPRSGQRRVRPRPSRGVGVADEAVGPRRRLDLTGNPPSRPPRAVGHPVTRAASAARAAPRRCATTRWTG